MAFPTVQGTPLSTQDGGQSGSTNFSLPTGVQVGELLMAFVAVGDDADINTPNLWSPVFKTTVIGQGVGIACFAKVADGSEGSTVTITYTGGSKIAGVTYRISGAGAISSISVGVAATGNSGSPNPPAVTAAGGSNTNLFLCMAGMDGANGTSAAPTNYSNMIQTATSNGGNPAAIGTAQRQLSAGSDDPSSFTVSSSPWITQTIVIPPPGGLLPLLAVNEMNGGFQIRGVT